MRITFLVAFGLMSGLFACSDKGINSTDGNNLSNIKNTWWSLQSFESVTGDTVTLASNQGYFVLFADSSVSSEPDSIYGNASLRGKTDSLCRNIYGANYWIGDDNSLSVGPIWTTKIYCGSSYTQYLQALGNAASFQISNDTLTIFQRDDRKWLIFIKQ